MGIRRWLGTHYMTGGENYDEPVALNFIRGDDTIFCSRTLIDSFILQLCACRGMRNEMLTGVDVPLHGMRTMFNYAESVNI